MIEQGRAEQKRDSDHVFEILEPIEVDGKTFHGYETQWNSAHARHDHLDTRSNLARTHQRLELLEVRI